MRLVEPFNIWWPDFETGGNETLHYMLGRVNDVDQTLQHVRTKGIAVQAGGHCGLWPRQLAKYFTHVFTFEPSPDMYECLKLNTQQLCNVTAFCAALSDGKNDRMAFEERRSGRSKVVSDTTGDYLVPTRTIDSLALPRCDLIYLDVEGHELKALAGAKRTIKEYWPIIVVEVLKGRREDVELWCAGNGYQLVQRLHNDWVLHRC